MSRFSPTPVLRFISAFVCGALLGSVLVNITTGREVDRLFWQNVQLSSQNDALQETVRSLQQQLSDRHSTPTVQKVEVTLQEAPDGFAETELMKVIQEELRFLIGKKLEPLAENPEIILRLLDGRRYTVNERELAIRLRILSIGPVTRLWLDAKVVP